MQTPNWLKMLEYRQALGHLSREMLSQSQKKTLTSSELEILSIIYMCQNSCTPLELSHKSGMKKEAVSRCLKKLYAKSCVEKKKNPDDERSYSLFLTDIGNRELKENYSILLKPLYELQRSMGDDFKSLFALIESANENLKNFEEEN